MHKIHNNIYSNFHFERDLVKLCITESEIKKYKNSAKKSLHKNACKTFNLFLLYYTIISLKYFWAISYTNLRIEYFVYLSEQPKKPSSKRNKCSMADSICHSAYAKLLAESVKGLIEFVICSWKRFVQ